MNVHIGTGIQPYRRRWRDGPTWGWLCYLLGHQKKWWHWYSWCGLKVTWHFNGTNSVNGVCCGRCGKEGV